MLRNYVLVSLRALRKYPLFSLINILGLALGLMCVILIALFVQGELGFDRQWSKADRTYRVMRNFFPPGGAPSLYLATNAPPVGPLLARDYPQFEHVVRLMDNTVVISAPEGRDSYYEPGVYFADPDVFSVFDIPLLEGDPAALFDAPFQVVIDASLAQKYFPQGGALGGTLMLNGSVPVRVTGVMADLPANTHLDAHAFASMQTAEAILGERMQSWGFNNFHTYVVAEPGFDPDAFSAQMPDFLRRHAGEDVPSFSSFTVIPVTDIHLHSQRDNELQANGSAATVMSFSAIAVFILLIACFNFTNLSTARSLARAREVGMRKVCGATRRQIALQFLVESCLIAVVAVALATGLVLLLLPAFNALLGTALHLDIVASPWTLPALVGVGMGVGVLAGLYPAMTFSAFPCATILRGHHTRGAGGAGLRKALVVLQFTFSIGLVIASGIALSQLRYTRTLDLGFTREQVLIYRGSSQNGLGPQYESMKQALLRHPDVVSVTAANLMPGDQNTNANGIRYEGGGPDMIGMAYLYLDFDFFSTLGVHVLSGRDFDGTRLTDRVVEPSAEAPRSSGSFVINELAARQMGWTAETALGKWIERYWNEAQTELVRGTVIGVVDNFHFSSLREPVKPVIYQVMPSVSARNPFPYVRSMAIRIRGQNPQATVADINAIWQEFVPGVPVIQSFLDSDLDALYEGERRQGILLAWFCAMAIFIASLGVLGLASYMTQQRTREIGIRKVLGSSVTQLLTLLTREFLILVIVAIAFAWPLSAFVMEQWLQGFAYRVSMSPLIFLAAAAVALLIAGLTVSLLAARTALQNPALSLRHE